MPTSERGIFDYVIVGAGSAGCLIAERLSANTTHRVALIEAGPEYRAWPLRVPSALPLLLRSRRYNWAFNTVPQPALDNRRLYWPRGRVIGGSSSINAMCAVRGPTADFERWAEYGGPEWSWATLQPLLGRIAGPAHGQTHPNRLPIAPLRYRHRISEAFVTAAREAGHPELSDFNVDAPEGVGFYPVFQHEAERWENARAFLEPARTRENLAVLTDARVLRVEMDTDRRATGVLIRRDEGTQHIDARREVILCAGTIGSPHLLMLSGIGPPGELRAFGLDVRQPLPGVGHNLQDHLDVTMVRYAPGGGGISARPRDLPGKLRAFVDYRRHRAGPFTSNLAEAGGFIRSTPATDRPDLQLHFLPAIQEDHGRKLLRTVLFSGCALHVCALYPESRGRIGLSSADPLADPRIDPCYLSATTDLEVLIAGLRKVREILRQPAFARYRLRPLTPSYEPANVHDLEALVRAHAETIYHPVGTCRLGTDANAVVDPQLRVHGVSNLRIADASVMPSLIGANTNIAVTLIAENASRLLGAPSPSDQSA